MSPGGNIPGVWALIAGIILAAVVLTPAGAQAELKPTRLSAPLVDWNDGKAAVQLVEQWLAAGKVPTKASSPHPVTGLIGIRITLRSAGTTAGWGDAYRDHLDELIGRPGPAVDMMPLLRKAARQAFHSVREHLRDARLHAVLTSGKKKTIKLPTIADLANRLLVDVQLGHDLHAIKLPAKAGPAALFHQFAPDYHGLRMTSIGARHASFVWPATALARNFSPQSQMIQLLARQGLGPQNLNRIARPGGPALARFDVVHVVRPASDMPIMHLVRGDVLLPGHSITGRTLNLIADNLASGLRNRFVPDPNADHLVVRGTYHPATEHFDPSLADPPTAALACYALTLAANYRLQLNRHDHAARTLAQTTLDTAVSLITFAHGKSPAPDTAALVLLTLIDTAAAQGDKPLRDHLGRWLLSLYHQGRFHLPGKPREWLPATAQTIITAALAGLYQHTRSGKLGKAVAGSMHAQWRRMSTRPDIAALPWLMLADVRATDLLDAARGSGTPAAIIARHAGMGRLIDQLEALQIVSPPSMGPADVIGGFQLQHLPEGAPPTPDWRSADVMALISIALRSKAVEQGHDQLGWLLSAGLAARFIDQLMIDRPACFYIQDTDQALGTVRAAPWDNRLPISATAMSLLAVTELQQTLAKTMPDDPADLP